MHSKLWRFFLAFGASLLVWLVPAVAHAERSPQCDIRGASSLAPPPQLQDSDSSIDVGVIADACGNETFVGVVSPSDHAPLVLQDAGDVALPVAPVIISLHAQCAEYCTLHAVEHVAFVPEGAKRGLLRPPR